MQASALRALNPAHFELANPRVTHCPDDPNNPLVGCNNPPPPPSLVVKAAVGRSTLRSVLIEPEEPPIAIPSELERTFRSHHGMVFRTAYRITGNAADAEDVLQTVFLRLVRRTADSDAMEKEESYLRRAAINASLDVVRSRQANPSVELVEVPSDRNDGEITELRQALGRALSTLQPRSAEIFTLRFIEGLTNLEIARMLGISQVLVAVTVYRTRQQLRKELAKYLGERP